MRGTEIFQRVCVVIGNGPSLRGFDFKRLSGVATLGMNAAYRHWDKIGWWPNYYCCLDDQLIETHHAEIDRLYAEGRVKKVFVHGRFFEHHPDRAGNPDFYSLDQVLPHWHKRRAAALGMAALYDRPAFRTRDTTKITTGAFATRFAAFMGHSKIALMGIDLRYVEILPEARSAGGIALVMDKTPEHNPNYFFDGYQQAGDRFNIPNPVVHADNLHTAAFAVLRDDFRANCPEVEIVNTNQKSVLSDRDIFPYESIEAVLGRSALGAVAIPTNHREIQDILANFELWSRPEFEPLLESDSDRSCDLVLIFNNRTAADFEEKLRQTYVDLDLGRFFNGLRIEYLALEGDEDRYDREYSRRAGPQGYKAGPNNQFFASMRLLRGSGPYAFLLETDCIAIRRGWLTRLRRVVDNAEPFWVMGSAYRGAQVIGRAFERHVNGSAIYAVDDEEFCAFLDKDWEPETRRLVRDVDPRLAYDCILDLLFHDASAKSWGPKRWRQLAHKFRYTNFIQNLSGTDDLVGDMDALLKRVRSESAETFIVHNRRIAGAVRRMDNEPALAPIVTSATAAAETGSKTLAATSPYPRTLIFDMTRLGDRSATGEIKATLFGGWPANTVLQFFDAGAGKIGVAKNDGSPPRSIAAGAASLIRDEIAAFNPEVILYRPVPNTPFLHQAAVDVIAQSSLPVVTWIMDDWPASLEVEDFEQFNRLDADLRWLLDLSSFRLSICDAMSRAFLQRYGCPFTAIANAVEAPRRLEARPRNPGTFRLRYAGGLAKNMSLATVVSVAHAVELLKSRGVDICLEIKTRPYWANGITNKVRGLSATTLNTQSLPAEAYLRWLEDGSALLIAYNDDEASRRYTRYSFANKLPECLASGRPVFAVGPKGTATIDYLAENDAAVVVHSANVEDIASELARLIGDDALYRSVSEKGLRLASTRHSLETVRELLADTLRRGAAAQRPQITSKPASLADAAKVLEREPRGSTKPIAAPALAAGSQKSDDTARRPESGGQSSAGMDHATTTDVSTAGEMVQKANKMRLYTRFALWAESESPMLFSLGQFAMWGLRTASRYSVATTLAIVALLGLLAVPLVPAVASYSPYALGAAALVALTGLVAALVGYMTHLSKKAAQTLETRVATAISRSQAVKGEIKSVLEGQIGQLKGRLDKLDGGLPALEKRISAAAQASTPAIAQSLTPVKSKLDLLETEVRRVEASLAAVTKLKTEIEGLAQEQTRQRDAIAATARSLALESAAPIVSRVEAIAGEQAAFKSALELLSPLTLWRGEAMKRLDAVTADATALKVSVDKLQPLIERTEGFSKRIEGIATEQATLRTALTDLFEKQVKPLIEQSRSVSQRIETVGSAVPKLEASVAAQVKASAEAADAVKADVATKLKTIDEDLKFAKAQAMAVVGAGDILNYRGYQPFKRVLTETEKATLKDVWSRRLSVPTNARALSYAAFRACMLEQQMQGRLATTMEDIMLRSMVTLASKRDTLSILEIGTLFGIGAAVLYDAAASRYNRVELTLIDPLDGYYDKSSLDIITNVPVSEKVLRKNFAAVGVDSSDVQLIKHLSTEPEAIAAASKRSYDVIIIDGDHSYTGVKFDHDNYSQFVRVGGYIIFDDYGATDWPDVKRFVDSEVMNDPCYGFVGSEWRTAVFRVMKRRDGDKEASPVEG